MKGSARPVKAAESLHHPKGLHVYHSLLADAGGSDLLYLFGCEIKASFEIP